MASVKDLLKKSLDELEEAELKKFRWHLRNDNENISKSDMENADRLKTVDKMVECFGPEEAVKITVEILRKMNQNNLAEQLENKLKQGKSDCSKAETSSNPRVETGILESRTQLSAMNPHIEGR
ncbi:NACHT, LRR and PYD domains-containing protein 6 [Anabarilius grahami]|uniref:NACHT, LRR and PYD domains-containing protein 6 n=1 Tax=Anabarilius grahami TaxID=495550 RepID=A0A3N0YY36_ANAGA|nr:NACHT, LRR and PYD domains-containing protein 6 [Anabarilius grahami]